MPAKNVKNNTLTLRDELRSLGPNEDMILDFLENVLQRDRFHLYFNDPQDDRRHMPGYVAPSTLEAVEWIFRQYEHRRGVFYAVNTPGRYQSKRAHKDDLKWLMGFHTDIDLPKGMDRSDPRAEACIDAMIEALQEPLPGLKGTPAIIYSGNGVQGLWPLAEPLKATKENKELVETVNKRIMMALRARLKDHAKLDACFNCDRVLRVPGTVNYPSKLKEAQGRVPVLARLIQVQSQDFHPDDFTKLPKVDAVIIRPSPAFTDYTLKAYQDWQPFTAADLLEDTPDLSLRVAYKLEDNDDDRSAGVWYLIQIVAEFMMRKTNMTAVEMAGDFDVKKNIAELCWELTDHSEDVDWAMQHVRDHKGGRGKLGQDIQRALDKQADEKRAPRECDERLAEVRRERYYSNEAVIEGWSILPMQARANFIFFMDAQVQKIELPDVIQDQNGPSRRQMCTPSNVEKALWDCGITASYDVMRDRISFTVADEIVGGAQPATLWAQAMAGVADDRQEEEEMALILDGLAKAGMAVRPELREALLHVAMRDRFHPLEAYCLQKSWDGVDRYPQVAACLNTDNPLVVPYLRTHFRQCAAVLLSLKNYLKHGTGVQLRMALVLKGPQHCGKSTFIEKITPPGMMSAGKQLRMGKHGDTDDMQAVLGGLVCELSEIASSFDRSHNDAFKDFQSRTVDRFRVAYARLAITKPRMTVLTGTGNENLELRDDTGSTRFGLLDLKSIDWGASNVLDVQQIFAQAYDEVVVRGLPWGLDEKERAESGRHNAFHKAVSKEEGALEAYLAEVEATDQGQYVDEWGTATHISRILDIEYNPSRWAGVRAMLQAREFQFKSRDRASGLQNVWWFPATREAWTKARTGAS